MHQVRIAARALTILNTSADLLARNGLSVNSLIATMDRRIEREHYNPVTVAVLATATIIDRAGRRLNRACGNTTVRRGDAIRVTLSGNVSADGDALENLAADLNLVGMGLEPVYTVA